jgi:hypothetical protein
MAREIGGWIHTATGELPEYPRHHESRNQRKVHLKSSYILIKLQNNYF